MTLPLFPYQEEGARILASRERFGLHDEMGVGKTATAWRAIDILGAKRGIVICPAHLRENWIGEARKFSTSQFRITRGKNIHDFYAWLRGRFNVLVTSYEQATKWANQIFESGEFIDFVVLDEAHYLKSHTTNRTRAILGPEFDGSFGLLAWADHIYHLTGTPMANDPQDIFTFLSLCKAIPGLSHKTFTKMYFYSRMGTYGMRYEARPEKVAELKTLIVNNSIRRTKRDVGLQLPPIFLTTTLVDGNTEDVRKLLKEHPGLEKAILKAIEDGGLTFIDAQHIMTLRRLVGEGKAVPYAHMLADEIYSGAGKRVVFGIHRDALTTIHHQMGKFGIKSVLINGETPDSMVMPLMREFQEGDAHVFIGNLKKAGTGLTLTAACDVDIFESAWSPADNAQALMRVHRIGQVNRVQGRFITLAKSIDEVVNKIVARKTAAIAQIEGAPMAASPLDALW